jgi:hypothetical protein
MPPRTNERRRPISSRCSGMVVLIGPDLELLEGPGGASDRGLAVGAWTISLPIIES